MLCNPSRPLRASVQTMEILDARVGSFVRQTIRNPIADACLTPERESPDSPANESLYLCSDRAPWVACAERGRPGCVGWRSSRVPGGDPGLICVAESLSQQPGRGNRSVAGASCSRPCPERPAPSAGYLISMAEFQQAGRLVVRDSRDGYPPKFKYPTIILASAKKNL